MGKTSAQFLGNKKLKQPTENLREEQDVGSEVRKQMLAPKNVDKYSVFAFSTSRIPCPEVLCILIAIDFFLYSACS